MSKHQDVLGTVSGFVAQVVAKERVDWIYIMLSSIEHDTYLFPGTRVEAHHHPVHERDIELPVEVEDALQTSEHMMSTVHVGRTSMAEMRSIDACGGCRRGSRCRTAQADGRLGRRGGGGQVGRG